MAYLTTHNLIWTSDQPDREELLQLLAPLYHEIHPPRRPPTEGEMEEVREAADGSESTKWYDAENHIAALSTKWPDTLFTLDCNGHDGDRWMSFIRNGQLLTKFYEPPTFDEEQFAAQARAPSAKDYDLIDKIREIELAQQKHTGDDHKTGQPQNLPENRLPNANAEAIHYKRNNGQPSKARRFPTM